MINISNTTTETTSFAAALNGKWERKQSNGTTWVINGQIAFVEGDLSNFPYKNDILSWHDDGTGHWGIFK